MLIYKNILKLFFLFAGFFALSGYEEYEKTNTCQENITLNQVEASSYILIHLPTTKGTIRYSKKGAHIIPSHPKGK